MFQKNKRYLKYTEEKCAQHPLQIYEREAKVIVKTCQQVKINFNNNYESEESYNRTV